MIASRVERLEKTIVELDARCLMHDFLIGHLLGSLGSASGDIRGFTNAVIQQVGLDIRDNGMRALGTPDAQRFADALKTLEYFSESLLGSMDRAIKGQMN
ncbi:MULTISPECIES: hypothetical protein [unclassified Rhizobium]|uniref:hypothetical protein n=1 Tax=unclassified Rhizobium TaxID=2613769 RepID=UPI0016214CED|nr:MULTISPECIES: hypothetical protein [unclassified Rhizobium]MBB3288144.1 hypothetical protein [Rhizobium sp. BK252]MBB3402992.1 hypothetical protein [Rhizobium sp. BK289]MBB3415569.1 hypothetical protein [Rhizobium sp. BK284]MBB3483350.1 hypothetical protein [Rhizobium sp. BK347]MDK4720159.1 hypothetical protein [Rhizobium sp. CNPSo 3968]